MFTAADFEFPAPLDPMRKHRRCGGTGIYHTAGGPVPCSGCNGEGLVYSPADRRRAAAVGDRRSALMQAMYDRARERGGWRFADEVHDGYDRLEVGDHDRLPTMYASLANGRVDDVIDALLTYGKEHAQ